MPSGQSIPTKDEILYLTVEYVHTNPQAVSDCCVFLLLDRDLGNNGLVKIPSWIFRLCKNLTAL